MSDPSIPSSPYNIFPQNGKGDTLGCVGGMGRISPVKFGGGESGSRSFMTRVKHKSNQDVVAGKHKFIFGALRVMKTLEHVISLLFFLIKLLGLGQPI